MTQTAKSFDLIRAAQGLFYLNAAIWTALGIISLFRLDRASSSFIAMAAVLAAMMFGNAGAMLVSGLGLGTRRKFWFFLALAVLLVNIVLTFTDQFGRLDLITLVIDGIILGLLIAARQRFGRKS